MKKILKKYWKYCILGLLLILAGVRVYDTFFKEVPAPDAALSSKVTTFSLSDIRSGSIKTSCLVQAVDDVVLVAESSGKVSRVYVTDGQEVVRGQNLFTLENITQRVAVQNAKVSLHSAELALSELLGDNDASNQNSLLAQTTNQQEQNVSAAKNAFFNNDLRAYPQDNPSDLQKKGAPIVEGNYTCEAEGEYIVEVYSSSTESGASFRYTGLESGIESASTTSFGTSLGSCGLELRFPENFAKRETWVIPVPNTRSARYTQSKIAYDNALSGKDITLNNIQASPERIAQERARVRKAQLQLESAYDALAKTTVKAPVAGTLSSFEVAKGDFVSSSTNLGRIKSIGNLEVVANISSDEVLYLDTENFAQVNGENTNVLQILPTNDTQTKRTKVVLETPETIELIEGSEYACTLPRLGQNLISGIHGGGVVVPLSAISVIGVDTYVFSVRDNYAYSIPVETGALLGDTVVVYGVEADLIIRDARGIREGQQVVVEL